MEARRFQFVARGVLGGRTERESREAFTPPLQRRTQPVRVLHLGPEDTEQFEIGVGEHDAVVRCRLSGMIATRRRDETETHPIRTGAVEILHPDDDVIEADDRFAHGVLPLRFSAAAFQKKASPEDGRAAWRDRAWRYV